MTLYERWRPRTWADVVGQPKALSVLNRLRKANGTLGGRAYFMAGPSGSGKTSVARLIAAEVADPFAIEEMDAASLSADFMRELPRMYSGRPLGGRGWAVIVNEVHSLRRPQVESLLTAAEPIGGLPPWFVWCFTTTISGRDKLFDECDDAGPFASRCTTVPFPQRGDLAKQFAERARQIAQAEGLDGQPIAKYIRLAQECRNNLRMMLQRIEAGEMIGSDA